MHAIPLCRVNGQTCASVDVYKRPADLGEDKYRKMPFLQGRPQIGTVPTHYGRIYFILQTIHSYGLSVKYYWLQRPGENYIPHSNILQFHDYASRDERTTAIA